MRKITLATEHSTRKSRYPLKKGPPCLLTEARISMTKSTRKSRYPLKKGLPCLLTEARISMTKSGLAWFIVFSCLG